MSRLLPLLYQRGEHRRCQPVNFRVRASVAPRLIDLVQDVIKRLNFSTNLCLELQEKSTFLGQKKKTRLIFFSLSLIKLCHSDHSLIGLLFLKMEVQQLKMAVSAAEKSFCDVICLGSVPSLRRRSQERQCLGWHCLYSNICSILCGRIRPSGIAVFLS